MIPSSKARRLNQGDALFFKPLVRSTLRLCQLDQLRDQLRVAHPDLCKQARVHADLGKAGHGVDLIHE